MNMIQESILEGFISTMWPFLGTKLFEYNIFLTLKHGENMGDANPWIQPGLFNKSKVDQYILNVYHGDSDRIATGLQSCACIEKVIVFKKKKIFLHMIT